MTSGQFGEALRVCRTVHGDHNFHVDVSKWQGSLGLVPISNGRTNAKILAKEAQAIYAEDQEVSLMLGISSDDSQSTAFTETYAVAAEFNRGLPSIFGDGSLSPTILLRTSPEQYQAVWVFERDTVSKPVAISTQRLIAKKWGASNSFARDNQMIRLPGFVNGQFRQDVRLMPESDLARMFEHKAFCQALEDCADLPPPSGRWDLLED